MKTSVVGAGLILIGAAISPSLSAQWPSYLPAGVPKTADGKPDLPKAYTTPFTVRVNQRLTPDQELIEFVCVENQKFDKYLRGDLRPK